MSIKWLLPYKVKEIRENRDNPFSKYCISCIDGLNCDFGSGISVSPFDLKELRNKIWLDSKLIMRSR